MTCKVCGKSVRNTFKSKLRHAVREHPENIVRVLAPLLENPYKAGEQMAEQLKGYVRPSRVN